MPEDDDLYYDDRPDIPWAEEHDDNPPRMERNANGSWYCNDCKCIVILFDNDKHYCEGVASE